LSTTLTPNPSKLSCKNYIFYTLTRPLPNDLTVSSLLFLLFIHETFMVHHNFEWNNKNREYHLVSKNRSLSSKVSKQELMKNARSTVFTVWEMDILPKQLDSKFYSELRKNNSNMQVILLLTPPTLALTLRN
jgi:hypothetical protein